MKMDLLMKLLNELGINPISENSVKFAMKKAVNNPIYWFFFKRKNLADNINFAANILSVVCVALIFIAGAFVSATPLSNWFIDNHVGPWLVSGLLVALIITVISDTILAKIISWRQGTYRYVPNLNDPLRKIFNKIETAINRGSSSQYYTEGIRLSKQRVNKTRFVFVRDRDDNRYCINVSETA